MTDWLDPPLWTGTDAQLGPRIFLVPPLPALPPAGGRWVGWWRWWRIQWRQLLGWWRS